MATPTEFREAVRAELEADLGIAFRAGVLDDVEARDDVGCVFWDGRAEMAGQAATEVITLTVRLFKRARRGRQPNTPPDPSELEQASQDLILALRDKPNTLGPWYARVTGVAPDYDSWSVEATVLAYQDNPFDTGA